jgi:hypothetical protein
LSVHFGNISITAAKVTIIYYIIVTSAKIPAHIYAKYAPKQQEKSSMQSTRLQTEKTTVKKRRKKKELHLIVILCMWSHLGLNQGPPD